MAAATVEAQAPRSSSNGPADSYIGSLISLTSKSEIRYEGVLFNINAQESSIGLRNVRSFGTEGRKMDGPQIPPSEKVYEYILFRGSDIKDLQVKSSPAVQTNTGVHDDPAIIRTHYYQSVMAATSLPSSGSASIPLVSAHTPQMGLPKPTFQSTLPMYQPLGSQGTWGSSAPPTTNGSGTPMTMYWQGFSGPSNGFQHQQQSLVMPSPGLSMPPSMQQPMLYPTINASLSAGSGPSTSKPSESPSPSAFLPPLGMATPNLHSDILPARSPALTIGTLGNMQSFVFPSKYSAPVSEASSSLIPNKTSPQTLDTAASSTSLPLVSPLAPALDKTNFLLPASEKPKTVPTAVMPLTSESVTSMARTSGSIFSGPSNGFQHQQQSLVKPSPGLSMPPSMQQPMLYPTINASLSAGSGPSTSKPSESPSPSAFLPPLGMATPNLHSDILPAQSPALTIGTLGNMQSSVFPSKYSAPLSEASSSLIPNKTSPQTLDTAASITSLPLVSPLAPALEKTNFLLPASEKPKTVPTAVMPLTSESVTSMARTSGSIFAEGAMPPLVTPGQFFQPELTMASSSQPSRTVQRDVEVIKVSSSSELPPSSPAAAKDSQEPILPLPSQSIPKLHGAHGFAHQSYRGGRERGGHSYTHQSHRGGRGRGGHAFTHQSYRGRERGGHTFIHQNNRGSERGRGNRISRPVTRFTEDFDFSAMNEKFNKDEVWGDLGKSNKALEDGGESQEEEDVGASPCDDTKNVYVKDDFFDSLSCDALDRGSHNGRTKFSEQLKKDTETFGYSPRYRGGRGGRWNNSYHGNGHGHAGQGRGHNFPNRASY